MDGWRTAFRWARNIFAAIGVLGCGLFLAAWTAFFVYEPAHRQVAPAQPNKPTLADAAWLLLAAGLDTRHASLHLLDSGRQAPDGDEGGGYVQAWCLRVDAMPPTDAHWVEIDALDPLMAATLARSVAAAHARVGCVPDAQALAQRFAKARMLRVEILDGRAQAASIALLEPGTGSLYVVNAALLPTAVP